jgi:hypothetical protein
MNVLLLLIIFLSFLMTFIKLKRDEIFYFTKNVLKQESSFKGIRNLMLVAFLFLSIQTFSQNKHNIPPGFKVYPKTNTEKDYSFKLNTQPNYGMVASTDAQFLKDLTPINMEDMKMNSPESYKYYSEALAYYKELSQRVKALYTGDEIWYIYMFDQNLKNKLRTIR